MISNKSISNNKIIHIFFRYSSLMILVYLFNLNLIKELLIKIYTLSSYYILNLFFKITLNNDIIIINQSKFLIIESCVAIGVYLLISLIYFTIPIKIKNLFKIYIKSILFFSIFNLIRILLLITIQINFGQEIFEKIHLIFYETISGILTAGIITYYLKKEKITKIYPIYSDLKYIYQNIKFKNK